MTMSTQTPAKKLFDLLVSRDFDPEMLDVQGMPAPDPSEAEIFSFDFRAESGKDYGTVVIMLGDDNNLDVYCADNVGRSMEHPDKDEWFQFLYQLKQFATKNFLEFGIKNLNRLRYSMQGQASIKEGLFESWTGTRTQSWNGKPTEARLMIKHKKTIGESDARFRYIESLFVETAEGERYKLPFTKLSGGRAMVEHIRNGGKPYDARGQHIVQMVNEMNVLSRFRRANQGKLFEGDTEQLVEQTNAYYENLQKTMKSLSHKKGYTNYFESWTGEVTEEEVVIEGLKHLFVTQSIDSRIEDALPLLAKIQQQGTAMKEANIFEAWAERLVEGTWQLPDTPEKQQQLVELMSTDLLVGADATNVTEQLYDLLGDDYLYDQLESLAERDANADARQVILDRMQELSDSPEIRRVIEQLNIDPTAEMNPPAGTPADLSDTPPEMSDNVPSEQGKVGRLAESVDPVNAIRRAAGLVESRLMDSAGETIDHILNRFKHEVKTFEQGGDLDEDLYHALFDYYSDAGEMPYGVQKARTGDPYEWVAQNLQSHLSGGGIVGGNPDEDFGLERESIMHGDYAEEAQEPHSVDGGMENPLIQGESVAQLDEVTPDEMAAAEWMKDPENRKALDTLRLANNSQTRTNIFNKGSLDMQTRQNLDNAVKQYKDAIRDIEGKRSLNRQFVGAVGGKPGAGGAGGEPTNVSDKMGQQITDIVQKAQSGQMDAGQAIAFINGQTQKITGKPVPGAKPAPVPGAKPAPVAQPTANVATESSPLAGQYGHSGKMKEVSRDLSFLDRLKELSGMKK